MVAAPKPFSFGGGAAPRRDRGRKDGGEPAQGCTPSDELRSGKDKGTKYLCRNGPNDAPGESSGLEGVVGRNLLENRWTVALVRDEKEKKQRDRGVGSYGEGSTAKGRFVRLRVTGVRVVKFAWKGLHF